jgi:hypothetical protein
MMTDRAFGLAAHTAIRPFEDLLLIRSEEREWQENQSSDPQEWRRLSKDLEFVAICLRGLAQPIKLKSMKATYFNVAILIEFTARLGSLWEEHNQLFMVVGEPVSIEGRLHRSAHHAVYDEAGLFLKRLRTRLDRQYWVGDDSFDPSVIIEEWDRIKKPIRERLSNPWWKDFRDVLTRIRYERDALLQKMQPPRLPVKQKSPNLPKVSLELNQIRYNGKCYDVSAECALLMHFLVEAYPNWIPASKCGFTKPSRIKDAFPSPLKALIETSPAKGYHLKLTEA